MPRIEYPWASYFCHVADGFLLIVEDAVRFKHLRKYVYNYEAESSSGVPGTADSRSATKINCKVRGEREDHWRTLEPSAEQTQLVPGLS